MLQYILECIAFQLVFLIIYDFFLKRETFFQWNRVYLIGTYILSLVLPWIKIEALKTSVPDQFYVYPEFLWNATTVSATVTSEAPSFSFSWEQVILYGGMLLATVYFVHKLYQIYKLRTSGDIQRFPNFTQVIVQNSELAFSFFRSIFLGDKVIERDHRSIIEHELVHIEQGHSWDLLFFELMRIVGWFNPLVYVYQSRVSELHEFIADSKVAKTDKKEQYEFLLSQIFQTENISFVNQFFKTSLIKKRIKMLQRAQSKKIWRLKYLLLLPLVFGMLLYTSSEAQEKEEILQEQTSSDAELIDKVSKKIEKEIDESGSIMNVQLNHREQSHFANSDGPLISKEKYFESAILFKMAMREMYINKPEKLGSSYEDFMRKIPPPSTARYRKYVKRKKAFQILDENLIYSIKAYEQEVVLTNEKEKYSDEWYVFEVNDTKDLTGKELRAFNNKLDEIFEQKNSRYSGLILTDGDYAFEILKTIPFEDLRKPDIQKEPETIKVGNVQNLTNVEEWLIFDRLKLLSTLSEDWELLVTDAYKESYIKYLPSNGGTYITGPNGEAVLARQILNYKPSVEEQKATEDFVSSVTQKKYDQLVAERNRLLKSSNEKNPVIVNLDQQIQGLKRSIDGESHVQMNSSGDLTARYNRLLSERKRLLKSTNENNPVIVNLDQQIAGLRKAVFGDGETIPFAVVEEVPVFPGCEGEDDKRACFQSNMQKHISKNFRYPQEAQEKGIQGRVAIMFTISETGAITNVSMRGPHNLLEEEAERIISRLPEMKPGKHKGELVNVPFSIPITFKLQSGSSKDGSSMNSRFEMLPSNISSDPELIATVESFNQLTMERNRLLKKSTVDKPVIVNLDNQLRDLITKIYASGEYGPIPFGYVDQVPIFPDCEDAQDKRACFQERTKKHISKNFSYPEEAQEQSIQGRVGVLFTITKDGNVENIRTAGPNKILEDEASRIISKLPKMTPAKHDGKTTAISYSIPITFKLKDNNATIFRKGLNLDTMKGISPIYIVDGKESTKEELEFINPNDIESMNVLKGEYAINIYGEKAKNGVITILTKKNTVSTEASNEIYKADTTTMSVTATAVTKNGIKIISGIVTDGMMGLPGATIGVQGFEKGVISDFDGKFTIKAKKGDTLVFQYIGLPVLKLTITDEEAYQITKKRN